MNEHQKQHRENGSASAAHDHHRHSYHTHAYMDDEIGIIHVACNLHDSAVVISGKLTLRSADYAKVRHELDTHLLHSAQMIQQQGGIIGHIKASVALTSVEICSITEPQSIMVKTVPEQTIEIHLAAIVFSVDPQEAEQILRDALTHVTSAASASV